MKGRRVSSAGIIRVGGQTLPDEDITGSAPSRANFGALSAAGAAGAAGAARREGANGSAEKGPRRGGRGSKAASAATRSRTPPWKKKKKKTTTAAAAATMTVSAAGASNTVKRSKHTTAVAGAVEAAKGSPRASSGGILLASPPETPVLVERFVPLPMGSAHLPKPTASEDKRAKRAPLLRRRRYGDELRQRNRKRYFKPPPSPMTDDDDDGGGGGGYDDRNNFSGGDDENMFADLMSKQMSEAEKEAKMELMKANMKRRCAEAMHKMRMDRSKQKAQHDLQRAKRWRVGEMSKMIRDANRAAPGTSSAGAGESLATASPAESMGGNKENKHEKVIPVNNDVVVRISTSWAGLGDTANVASNDVAPLAAAADPDISPWGHETLLSKTHRPPQTLPKNRHLRYIADVPVRKPSVPKLSGRSKKKKSSKKKKKSTRNAQKVDNSDGSDDDDDYELDFRDLGGAAKTSSSGADAATATAAAMVKASTRKPPVPRLSARARSAQFPSGGDDKAQNTPSESNTRKKGTKRDVRASKTGKDVHSPATSGAKNTAAADKASETARRRAEAKLYIHRKKQQRHQDKLRAQMAREMSDQKRLASLRALDTQSRKVIKARQRAAAAAALESKPASKSRKHRKRSGGATAAAASTRMLRERRAAKKRQKQKQDDVYGWQPIMPVRRGGSSMFDVEDLSEPALPSPQRRLGLSSEEEEEEEEEGEDGNDDKVADDADDEDNQGEDESGFLNRQAFLQGIEVNKEVQEQSDQHSSHDEDMLEEDVQGTTGDAQVNYSFEYPEGFNPHADTTAAVAVAERLRVMALREEANELTARIRLMKSTSPARAPPAPSTAAVATPGLPIPLVVGHDIADTDTKRSGVATEEGAYVDEETEEYISPVGIGVSSISTKAAELQVPPTPKRLVSAPADHPERTPRAIATRGGSAKAEATVLASATTTTSTMPPFLSAKSAPPIAEETSRQKSKKRGGGIKAALADLERQDEVFEATLASVASQRRLDEEAFVHDCTNPVLGVLGMEEAEAVAYPQVDLELAAEAAAAVAAATRASQEALKQGQAIAAQVDAFRRVAAASSTANPGGFQAVPLGSMQNVPVQPAAMAVFEQAPSLSVMDVFARQLGEESVKASFRAAVVDSNAADATAVVATTTASTAGTRPTSTAAVTGPKQIVKVGHGETDWQGQQGTCGTFTCGPDRVAPCPPCPP